MNIVLDPTEVQQAIAYYLGSEYNISAITGVKGRNGGDFKIHIDCSKEFQAFEPTKAEIPVPSFGIEPAEVFEADIDTLIDNAIDDVLTDTGIEVPVDKAPISLFNQAD